MRRRFRMNGFSAFVGGLLILAGCGTSAPTADETLPHLVGDSTAAQVAVDVLAAGGTSSATPGCGFNAYNCDNRWAEDLPEDRRTIVVGFVSYWDVICEGGGFDCEPDVSGYVDAQAFYRQLGYDVVWVEVPPLLEPFATRDEFNPQARRLNSSLSAALGCELVPHELRDAARYDGLHYFPGDATLEVADRLLDLDRESACR